MNNDKIKDALANIELLDSERTQLYEKLKRSLAILALWPDAFQHGPCSSQVTGNARRCDSRSPSPSATAIRTPSRSKRYRPCCGLKGSRLTSVSSAGSTDTRSCWQTNSDAHEEAIQTRLPRPSVPHVVGVAGVRRVHHPDTQASGQAEVHGYERQDVQGAQRRRLPKNDA